MDKVDYLTIYCTFANLDVVRETLPTVIAETSANDARLIVHDSTDGPARDAKWSYLRDLNRVEAFVLLLSSNISMAHARNMCLHLGQELYAPDIVAIMEDDHGYRSGFISTMTKAIRDHYGQVSPNGLRIGLFTGCTRCNGGAKQLLEGTNHCVRSATESTGLVGGANSCFRCAPSSHWHQVLKGYDTDEYLISRYQTKGINERNYNKGFTSLIVESGDLMFKVEVEGRGTSGVGLAMWDDRYCVSDTRSRFRGKGELDGTALRDRAKAAIDLAKKAVKKIVR